MYMEYMGCTWGVHGRCTSGVHAFQWPNRMADIGELPHILRDAHRFKYDLAQYPFPSLVANVLGEGGQGAREWYPPDSGPPLNKLHELPGVQAWLWGNLANDSRAYTMRRNAVDCRFKDAGGFRAAGLLRDCYQRFVREVAAPLVAADGDVAASDRGYYQRDPNFRAHLPDTGFHLTQRHCDAQYHHQPLEVNFWIPLTQTYGSNSLWVESTPGAGDFSALELSPGEGVRFWGHSCEHYTLPNETDETRLSFDFRVVPPGLFREHYPNSHRRDGTPRFAAGGFFDKL